MQLGRSVKSICAGALLGYELRSVVCTSCQHEMLPRLGTVFFLDGSEEHLRLAAPQLIRSWANEL
jgi:hypothetical protein